MLMFVMMTLPGKQWPEPIAEVTQKGSKEVCIESTHPDMKPFFEALYDKGISWNGTTFFPQDSGFLDAFEQVFCSGSYMYLNDEANIQVQSFASIGQVA